MVCDCEMMGLIYDKRFFFLDVELFCVNVLKCMVVCGGFDKFEDCVMMFVIDGCRGNYFLFGFMSGFIMEGLNFEIWKEVLWILFMVWVVIEVFWYELLVFGCRMWEVVNISMLLCFVRVMECYNFNGCFDFIKYNLKWVELYCSLGL